MSAFIAPFPAHSSRAKRSPSLTHTLHRSAIRQPSRTRAYAPTMCTTAMETLENFLRAAGDLGTLRFITVANGAVLETVGRLDYGISKFSIPGKGDYLTIASVDKTFECHINTTKVRSVTLSSEKAKMGNHQLHVIRLLGEDGAIILSMLLQWDPSKGPGNYLHGAESAFQSLKQSFGSSISL